MNLLYFIPGLLVYLVTLLDLIKTTFSSNGGGMITSLVAKAVWKAFFLVSGKDGKARILTYAGPAVLLSVLLVWVIGIWAGFFLLLMADPDAVQKSTTLALATPLEKLYYAGFTLFTLGVGDYVATTDFWRILTDVAGFTGLAFITASITYFVPVLSAVGLQSKLSLYLNSMGKTPQRILANSWDGEGFSAFFDNVSDICQMLMQHTINHHSYPVIHYFHNSNPRHSIAPAIALLDETHRLLRHAVDKRAVTDDLRMTMLQAALDDYLDMVKGSFIKDASTAKQAPVPDLSLLKQVGIPLQNENDDRQAIASNEDKRRELLTLLLQKDGWGWAEVY
ncbi:potassium channel family protein [Pontibacter sp. CAU 1760]